MVRVQTFHITITCNQRSCKIIKSVLFCKFYEDYKATSDFVNVRDTLIIKQIMFCFLAFIHTVTPMLFEVQNLNL